MEGKSRAELDDQILTSRLFLRLQQDASDYDWDNSKPPFHSSYDNWHVWGSRRPEQHALVTKDNDDEHSTTTEDFRAAAERQLVVARVSRHALRLEREYRLAEKIRSESNDEQDVFIKPIEFLRLPVRQAGDVKLVAMISESPGNNYLVDMVELGPNFYRAQPVQPVEAISKTVGSTRRPTHHKTPLRIFMTFALGAAKCLEQMHHGSQIVHGELRGDAFHFNKETGVVKLVNFGSGARSFENGLTSAGWSVVTSQIGVEHRLQFIAPEQTGRTPAEPDSRTDIYSLGVLYWTMLADEPAFPGTGPLEIMQNVLSRRIAPIESKRPDVSSALSKIIHKMTQRNMGERYQSAAGLRYDLVKCQEMLEMGNAEGLANFKLGTKDVSSSFHHPSRLIGRQKQLDAIKRVIERAFAAASNRSAITKSAITSLRAASSFASERYEQSFAENATASDTASTFSKEKDSKSSTNGDGNVSPSAKRRSAHVQEAMAEASLGDNSLQKHQSNSSRVSIPSIEQSVLSGGSKDGLLRKAQQLRRTSRCEIVAIAGDTGLGKSSLILRVQSFAREHGYYASAKCDPSRKAPFEPALRIMSLLFRQMFSESDVTTSLHEQIRALVRPVWSSLHKTLELPPWLISPELQHTGTIDTSTNAESLGGSQNDVDRDAHAAHWLKAGGVVKDRRFAHIFVDFLRILAMHEMLCICLDDVQYADDESVDLMHSVIAAGTPVVFIIAYRSIDNLPTKTWGLADHATMIELKPFTEEQTSEYIQAALHRPVEYCMPLVAVIQQKSGGVPVYVRELLDQCYSNKGIYYSWKASQWECDFETVFNKFTDQSHTDVSSDGYIYRRLMDLSQDAKTLLCWASLIGNTFTFTLLNRVMSCDCSKASPPELLPPRAQDSVVALQSALASFAIMATDEEDRFRFSHDRYIGIAKQLRRIYQEDEMHFVIAAAMMKHDSWDSTKPTQALFDQTQHICEALPVIKARASTYKPFRQLLYHAAEISREQGARQTSVYFLNQARQLLGQDIWHVDETKVDTTYEEVLTLVTQIAGSYWYLEDFEGAKEHIDQIFKHARTAADRSSAYVIRSRMYTQQGDSKKAFETMTSALTDMGYHNQSRTWEECDVELQRIVPLLLDKEPDLGRQHVYIDSDLRTTGAVMVEMLSAAFWSDSLLFYQMTLTILHLYLDRGLFPQVVLGFIHVGSIAIARFSMLEFGVKMGGWATNIMHAFQQEAYANGRGWTLHALFIGHIETSMAEQLIPLQRGLEATIMAGDKILQTLNTGVTAAYKVWASQDLNEVEQYISDLDEQIPNWSQDLRGGSILVGVRQYARAMQGKTLFRCPSTIMDDSNHSMMDYHKFIREKSSSPSRPVTIYDCYHLALLYRYGYYEEAFELGQQLEEPVKALFCMRFYYFTNFFFALSMIEKIRAEPENTNKEAYLGKIRQIQESIKAVSHINDANFGTFLHILGAEMAELEMHHEICIVEYEAAINHAVVHGFVIDTGLANELYAEFLIRKGSTRPARSLIDDANAAYRSIGAHGKIQQLREKHAFTIHRTEGPTRCDVGVQTIETNTGNNQYKLTRNEDDMLSLTSEERTKLWLTPNVLHNTTADNNQDHSPSPARGVSTAGVDHSGLSALGLDMIDLATILESSQLLSSELDIEKLLASLTDIIVDATGAEVGGVIVKNYDHRWVIAALRGGVDGHVSTLLGKTLESTPDSVARSVTLYCLRFRESLFIPNIVEDERFAVHINATRDSPEGCAIIAIPIIHGDDDLLGCIYIQGPPRSFTQRNTAVLRLLVNQVSISIANAMLFKKLEKASASNVAMLEIQKQALDQAREAERKAKAAEIQAMEMLRLKEEAAKAKNVLLANVSHELRTPLNGVIGMSELLKAGSLSKEQEGYADSIRVCADTLLSVINDILDFSKLEAGKMQMFNVQLSLNETISEVVRALSYTNLERGLQTVEELEISNDMLVMGDPVRLHQVLMNLLSNAYKFTAKGKVTVKAVIEHETDTIVQVICSVTDTGIGISEEQKKKLFLPFSQADSSTARSYGGTGLGLSICKAIIEIMKGRIWLTSEYGVGTTVAFSIPFQKVDQAARATNSVAERNTDPMSIYRVTTNDAHTSSTHPHRSISNISRDQIKICIAEDNAINQKIAISFVERLGFRCKAYPDGQQAVDALIQAATTDEPFHLVLMDCQMPVLDGYNATREIRRNSNPIVSDVLIIAMTASAIRGDREKCLEAGMNNYLAKPVRANVLKQMLEGYLNAGDKEIGDVQGLVDGIAKDVLAPFSTT